MLDAHPRTTAGYPDILGGVKKVLVSIDEDLLAEIDRSAQREGVSRSAWISLQAARGLSEPVRSRAERAEAAVAEIRRIYLAAPRTSAPIIPTALELKRMHAERLDKIDRAARGGSSETA